MRFWEALGIRWSRWALLAWLASMALAFSTPVAACPADVKKEMVDRSLAGRSARARPVSIPIDQIIDAEGGDAPGVVGRWGTMMDWGLTAINAALLPTGKVLVYARPDEPPGGSAALLWDPISLETTPLHFDRDLFCSGMSMLPNGQIYMTGGNDRDCAFQGTSDTHLFDPWEERWVRLEDMTVERWYPTNTPLSNGRVLITSGLDRRCRLTPVMEMFTPGIGLEVVPEGERSLDLYPRLHVLSNGWVAGVGTEASTWMFNPDQPEWHYVGDTVANIRRWSGSSVQVPGSPDSILIFGGDSPAVNSVERIDFSERVPRWRSVSPMYFPRSHFNPVQLPDRTIMIVGGGGAMLYDDPVLNAELYDPENDTWTLLPAQRHPRMYHSTALLLPDGRVLSAGQDLGVSIHSAEMYEPAYLHRGARPTVTGIPDSVGYGERVVVEAVGEHPITSAALIAPGAVTHGVNMGQRFVDLAVTVRDGEVEVQMPTSGHLAPAGYYMLFLVDDDGVPSVGQFVRLAFGAKR